MTRTYSGEELLRPADVNGFNPPFSDLTEAIANATDLTSENADEVAANLALAVAAKDSAVGNVTIAEDYKNLAETFAGISTRGESVAALGDPTTFTEGDQGYVSGSGDDAVDGVYEVISSAWVRTGDNSISTLNNNFAKEQIMRVKQITRLNQVDPFDFDTEVYQRVLSAFSNADTRYDVTLSGSDLIVDLRQAAVMYAGARYDSILQQTGSTYQVQGTFDAGGTSISTNSGIAIGFDNQQPVGADVIFSSEAYGWTWRSNGVVTGGSLVSSGLSDSEYAFNLTSGTVSSFVAGDELLLELVTSNSAAKSVLKGYKNGLEQFQGTVETVPSGTLLGLFRGQGESAAYPSAQRFTFNLISGGKTFITTTEENVLEPSDVVNIPAPVIISGESYKSYLARIAPTGFENIIPTNTRVVNYGRVTMNQRIISKFLENNPAIMESDIAFVEMDGNDGSAIVGDEQSPFQTLDGALQSTALVLLVGDGVYSPPDYRLSQTAGGVPKLIIAKNTGKVVLRTSGLDLTTATWTLHSGDTWKTTVASVIGNGSWNANAPHHVRLNDDFDEFGFETRLPVSEVASQDATGVTNALTVLDGMDAGWVWDGQSAEKTLYVKLGVGVNVEGVKDRLQGLFYNSGGADRVFIYGATLAFSGVSFDGPVIWAFPSGTTPSHVWCYDGYSFNSIGYGFQVDGGGTAIIEDFHTHASYLDGINPDPNRSSTGSDCLGFAVNSQFTHCGDKMTFGTAQSTNRQGVSSHGGFFAAFGCLLQRNWGQEAADTATGTENKSWYVGCVFFNGDADLASNTGIGLYAAREGWLDTCAVAGEGANSLYLEGGASAKIFNCDFDVAPAFVTPSVAPVEYTPDSPNS